MRAVHRAMPLVVAGWLGFSPLGLVAQQPNEFDYDTTQQAVITIAPNAATHTITGSVTYSGQNLVLHSPLVVRAGAELRLEKSVLHVHGSVTLEDGGRITVIDSTFLLPCHYQREYEFRIEGGLVHTERALIGSAWVNGALFSTRFLHLRGTWLARQTVVQAMVPVLSYGRGGWGGPAFKGGSIDADGLYEGDRADGIHMSGLGDATLANGSIGVAFYYDVGANQQPSNTTLNLDSRSRLNAVYGDPLVHSGVTRPLGTHLNRLELRNHRVTRWFLYAMAASSHGPLQTITLQNAEDITGNVVGTDLTGSPELTGPWSSYYSTLPGLPSTAPPGHHAIPPGCGVRLGNVLFQSGNGANDWNRIQFWALYTHGPNTNLTVTGPSAIVELQMRHGGQVNLIGTDSFEMGVMCETVRLFETTTLNLDNVALGAFNTGGSTRGIIEANDSSTCNITNARAAPVRLRTTSAGALIRTHNVFGAEHFSIDTSGGGTVQVEQAAPNQSWDLQNLDFESSLLAGSPRNWSARGLTSSRVADPATGAGGAYSLQLVGQLAPAKLQKHLVLPPQTFVSLIGRAKVMQTPAAPGQLLLQARHGNSVAARVIDPSLLNSWQRVHLPTLTVGTLESPTVLEFVAAGTPATVRLDDFRVQLGSWWENDNLANLHFEWGCRYQGAAPTYWSAPDGWNSHSARCVNDSSVVRPGATPGSRAVQLTLQGESGSIYKDLTFLRAGDTVDVRGWTRGVGVIAGGNTQVIVGDGYNFYLIGSGSQHSGGMPCDGTWRQFQLTYVVPNNPSFTRIFLGCFDGPGAQCWWDDLSVTIR